MSIDTETYVYKLRFSLDKDAPLMYTKRWLTLKKKCEGGINKHLLENIAKLCLLKSNQNLPYLKRCEGGLGGDDNTINKQIRFRSDIEYMHFIYLQDNDIVMDQIYNTDTEKWSYDELGDLLCASIKVFENQIQCEDCIVGRIEMIPHRI